MAFTYIAPKIPNRNVTADELIGFIEAHIENQELLARRVVEHWKGIKKVWKEQGRPDMENTGYIQQATCVAGAPYFKGLHRCLSASDSQADTLHTIFGFAMDDSVNEGNKCWP